MRRSSLIAYALSHVLSSGFKQRIEGIFTHNEGLLASLFDLEIRQELIAARSRLDLLTLQDPLVTSAFAEANTLNALGAASHLVNLFSHAFNLWSQISLFRSFSRSGRTASTKRLTAFALSAALLQYLRWFIVPPLPERSRPTDPAFQRLSELWNLSCQAEEEAASAELKLLNLDKYLAHQFRLARDQLANVATIRNRGYQTIQTVLDLLSHAWPTFLRCAFILRAVGVHPSVPSGNVSQLAITTMCARKIASTFSSLIASMDDVRLDCTKIRSLYQILDIQPSIKEPEEPALYERVAGPLGQGMKIEFRDVCFSYHGSRGPLALQDVSFTLSPGSLVCVVGGNGAGKSTLIKLLTRLFEPTSGEILVNDRPISAYSTASLHAMMAVQLQHVPRSHLTIAEFIALGRAAQSPKDTIDETAVRQALIKADAMHIVDRLDRGIWSRLGPYPPRATPASILSEAKYYDEQFKDEWAADAPLAPTAATATDASQQTVTAVAVTAAVDTKNCDVAVRAEKRNTTWGLSFSGGEWQKLCFARSLMKDADLRIFDEPAAALDALAAETIFRNIEELRGKQTILHVTHQLRSAVSADLILCLQNGRIVEQGVSRQVALIESSRWIREQKC